MITLLPFAVLAQVDVEFGVSRDDGLRHFAFRGRTGTTGALLDRARGERPNLDAVFSALGADLVDLMKIPIDDDQRIVAFTEKLNGLLADETPAVAAPRLRKVAEENYDWSARAKQMVAAYGRFAKR